MPSVKVVNSTLVESVTWCNKHFCFSPIQNDSVRWWIFFDIAPPPLPECHGLKRVSMTLHLKVALCKVVPQAALGNRTMALADTPG